VTATLTVDGVGLMRDALAPGGARRAEVAAQLREAAMASGFFYAAHHGVPAEQVAQQFALARRLLDLPPETRLFMCHDYPVGREPRWETTVAEQRAANIHARDGVGEAEFVAMRKARDASLAAPRLMAPALQANIRAGG